jgi:hypothetical protein
MGFEWKDVGNTVATFAPALGKIVGNVVGGPEVGTLAGNAISGLMQLFGLKPDATPDQLNQAIAKDPQAALKLKQAEMDYQLAEQKEITERLKAELADVQSARSREVEVTKATGKRDINLYVLAWVVMGGFLSLIGFLIFMQFSTGKILQSDPLITLLLGSLSTDAGMVIGYFFGSSKSSAEKTQLLSGINNRGIKNVSNHS